MEGKTTYSRNGGKNYMSWWRDLWESSLRKMTFVKRPKK